MTPSHLRESPHARSTAAGLLLLIGICLLAYAGSDREVFHFDSLGAIGVMVDGGVDHPWRRLLERPFKPDQILSDVTLLANASWNRAWALRATDVTSFLVVNVALHTLVACLLFLLLRELLERTGGRSPMWLSLAGASAFAVHPVHIYVASYVIQRRSALVAIFTLLGALAYLKARGPLGGERAGSSPAAAPLQARVGFAMLTVLCLWLALHSKSVGLMMALSLIALEVCLSARDPRVLKKSLRFVLGCSVLMAVALAYYVVDRGYIDPATLEFNPRRTHAQWGVWPQFLTQARAIAWYQLLLAFPLPSWSAIDHQLPLSRTLFDHSAAAAVALHLGWLTVAVVALWKRHCLLALGIAWFYIPLIPYLLVPEIDHLVEYKAYLSSVGVVILAVASLRAVLVYAEGRAVEGARARAPVAVLAGAVAAVIVLLFATTVRSHAIFQSAIALWEDALEAHPGNPRGHYNLGLALAAADRDAEALPHLKAAVRGAPAWAGPPGAIAHLLSEQGRPVLAQRWWTRAVEADPKDPEGRLGLAGVLLADGQPEEALLHVKEALRRPRRPAVQANALMGRVLSELGQNEAAIGYYRLALDAEPDSATIQLELGIALQKASKLWPPAEREESKSAAREALQNAKRLGARENEPDFHFALGEALWRVGSHEAAIAELRVARSQRPDWVEAANNLAWHLASAPAPLRNVSQALVLAEFAALQTGRRDPMVLDTLAAVLMAAGRRDEALETIDEALAVAAALVVPAAGASPANAPAVASAESRLIRALRETRRGIAGSEPASAAADAAAGPSQTR